MGFQDREYYREQSSYGDGLQPGGQRMLVTNLAMITIAVFLIDAFTPAIDPRDGSLIAPGDPVISRRLDDLLSLDGDLIQKPWKFWQLLTYGFVHAPLGSRTGIWHVGMNMFMLWMFGRDIEVKYGRREFLRFYLIAIVFTGLVWLVLHNLVYGFSGGILGASGAVTAVLILFIANHPRRTLYLWGVIAVPAWLVGILYVGTDLLGASSGRGNVAYEAHLAGAAFALLYHGLGWNFERLGLGGLAPPRRWLQSRPELKVHNPDESYQRQDLEADRILEKVHREGQESLTSRERLILEDYSRRMRQKHR